MWPPVPGWQRSKGELQSLEEVLHGPLPDAEALGASVCSWDCEEGWDSHPTRVEEWPGWEEDVKARLQQGTLVRLALRRILTVQ